MSGHVHTVDCTRPGAPCHVKVCKNSHPTLPDVHCARFADHAGDHDAFGPAMARIHWN